MKAYTAVFGLTSYSLVLLGYNAFVVCGLRKTLRSALNAAKTSLPARACYFWVACGKKKILEGLRPQSTPFKQALSFLRADTEE